MLSLLRHHLVARATVVRPAVTGPTVSAVASTVIVLPPESLQPLFLGVSVDVGSNDETDDVEERHPGLLGQESLRKRQGDGRGDPRDLHDGHEAGAHGGADLVERTRSSNDGHAEEVYGVLNGEIYGIGSVGAALTCTSVGNLRGGLRRRSGGASTSDLSCQQRSFAGGKS